MWIYVFIAIVGYCMYIKYIEPLVNVDNTKTVTNIATCQKCKIYNHRDARSQCDQLCKDNFSKSQYTGNWTNEKDGASCECAYAGKHTLADVDAPFLWNNEEAKQQCPGLCMKAFKGQHPNTTGGWKTISANTSACECSYYK